MRTITTEELKTILDLHKKWLNDEEGGERANLRCADLNGANLSSANLRCADLRCADLRYANLRSTNLSDADLRYANLRYADFSDADLSDAKYDETTSFFALQCPEEGSFIAYKKANLMNYNECIIKLSVAEDALRSSATSRKCRCSKAKVISIEDMSGNMLDNDTVAISGYDSNFVYKVGETVEVKDFNANRWSECASGIHFFITKDEARNY